MGRSIVFKPLANVFKLPTERFCQFTHPLVYKRTPVSLLWPTTRLFKSMQLMVEEQGILNSFNVHFF